MWVSDAAIVFATLVGPIFAVQAQKFVERRDLKNQTKTRVFESLMATRTSRLAPEHVRALNMIDLTYYGAVNGNQPKRSRVEQAVIDAWRVYLDHLSEPPNENPLREENIKNVRDELFTNLLEAIAKERGFSFDRVQLKKGAYTPIAFDKNEKRQEDILQSLTELLNGKRRIGVLVRPDIDQ